MYKIATSQYEGPLDLLLSLIEKKKLNILELRLKDITDDYLLETSNLKHVNTEDMAEFLYIASTLVEIKSRTLLPQEIIDEEEEDLLEKIIEYKKYKILSYELQSAYEEGIKRFYRYPDDLSQFNQEEDYINTDVQLLYNSLLNVFIEKSEEKIKDDFDFIKKEKFTVSNQMKTIENKLRNKTVIEFQDVLSSGELGEAIATFLALLELLKIGRIRVVQNNNCEIKIGLRDEHDN